MKRRVMFAVLLLPASVAQASDFGAAFGGLMIALFESLVTGSYLLAVALLAWQKVFTKRNAVTIATVISVLLGVVAIFALLLCASDSDRMGVEEWGWVIGNLVAVAISFVIPLWQFRRSATQGKLVVPAKAGTQGLENQDAGFPLSRE